MKNKDWLYLFAYYVLKFLVHTMPDFILDFLAFIVAKIVFKINSKHRKIIDVNLQICFPEKNQQQRDELSFQIYRNFANFGLDCIKNQNTNKEKILNKIVIENEEILNEAIKNQRSIIFTTAHYGNWELLSLAYAVKFGAISIVGRKLKSQKMDSILAKNRTQFNIELIDKQGGLRKMLNAIKNKQALGILTDQDCTDSESMKLDFFGKKVNFQIGASVLAQRTKALILPAFVYQDKDKNFHIRFFKTIDPLEKSIEELTLYQAKCCEEMIKFKPDEYFFFHRRFASYNETIYKDI
ncbi:lipid A biosynthesis lauroyl acyltransferase [Campylobacter estrildidarum]|uniref:Lauroyl acyltransferase n=1 Tax=Campylobacter estrildidarum TaxID=2510189 RepID=A0A4U7BKE4_9BACT|nr:lipid A biosynthesis lauroyl acyltransferase [Campylobacter estrildidarum]TKX32069.1 lauroyl acyltransferase [Campylobacter estrildidarum]